VWGGLFSGEDDGVGVVDGIVGEGCE